MQKRKLMLPLVLILMMCQAPPRTNQNVIDFESQASQLLHQKSIDFKCKNGFQRGMPFRAVHPPRTSKGKTTPIKNRPHSCEVDPFAKKQTDVATCTYTIDVPDFTMNQPKQKWLGIRSITIASSKKHRFQLLKWFSKGDALQSCSPTKKQ